MTQGTRPPSESTRLNDQYAITGEDDGCCNTICKIAEKLFVSGANTPPPSRRKIPAGGGSDYRNGNAYFDNQDEQPSSSNDCVIM
ncbi:MAG: hypothetical protein SNF33_02780 [Candidatus Algichlamydia australiensis]|nr:hypothetical protein [Chlamydiales bacterium]